MNGDVAEINFPVGKPKHSAITFPLDVDQTLETTEGSILLDVGAGFESYPISVEFEPTSL